MKMMLIAKLPKVCLAAMLIGTMGWGAGWLAQAGGSAEQKQQQLPVPNAVANQDPKREEKCVDLHGDPLPAGAVMRLGTVQLRAAGAILALSPDGKTLVGLRGGRVVSFWDAASGKLKATRGFPDVSRGRSTLSADGR